MKAFIFTVLLFLSHMTYAMNDISLKAHVHGSVDMTLVAESTTIEVHITSPLMNLVGFEYQAKTAEEKQALEQMQEVFNTPHNWLKFDEIICELSQYSVNYSNEAEESHHAQHSHDHYEHEHQSEHAQHAELEANYRFTCDNTKLSHLNLNLADHFSGIETIELSWIVNKKSGVARLHPGEKEVVFNP